MSGRVVGEARRLEPAFIPAHRHVEHVLAHIDSCLRQLAHPPPPALVLRTGPPTLHLAPTALVDAGSRPRILPRHRRRGRGADLTNKLMASRRSGLPGTPSSPTPSKAMI